MDRDARTEVLTWVTAVFTVLGVLLTAFIAFPSLPAGLGQLRSSQRPLAGLVIFVIAGIAASAFWARRNLNIPDLTRLEVVKAVTILDQYGKTAKAVRTQKERANRNLSSHSLVITNLKVDGTVDEMKINGEDVKDTEKEIILGACRVTRTWQEFLKKGQVVETEFSCTVLDSYIKTVEKEILVIPINTDKVQLEINLPASRPVIEARAYLAYGDQPHAPLPEPKVSDQRRKITLPVKNPKLGAQYYLEWRW